MRWCRVVVCATVLVAASTGAVDGSTTATAAPTACPSSPRPTPREDLPEQFDAYPDLRVFGNGVLWTVAPRTPSYSARTKTWTVGKQPWFRLSDGDLTVEAQRANGRAGTFRAELPPTRSYPLDMNLHIGPGFMPSSLEFTAPGCWKVVATLGSSTVVFPVNIDGSARRVPR